MKNHQEEYQSLGIRNGITILSRAVNRGMREVLRERGVNGRPQTHAEAAAFLGISLSYFQRLYHLRAIPNLFTPTGKALEERLRLWAFGMSVDSMFPGVFFSRYRLDEPKTVEFNLSYNHYLRYYVNGNGAPLGLPAPKTPHMKQYVPPKRKRDLSKHRANGK